MYICNCITYCMYHMWWHQGMPSQFAVSRSWRSKSKGIEGSAQHDDKSRKSLQWGQHVSSVPMYLPKGNPMLLTQKAVRYSRLYSPFGF